MVQKIKKRKTTSRARLINKMIDLAKKIAKLRDNYTCVKCKKKVAKSNCQASHIIPVSKSKLLAFNPDNLDTMCYHCHLNWWHKNPLESSEWFKKKNPERYIRLKQIANGPTRSLKEFELKEIYDKLLIQYKQYVDNSQKR